MLRWDLFINNNSKAKKRGRPPVLLASWLSDDEDTEWVEKLADAGVVRALDMDMFPYVIFMPASVLLPSLYKRLTLEVGSGKTADLLPPMPVTLEINFTNVFLCSPQDELVIEVWSNQQAYFSW